MSCCTPTNPSGASGLSGAWPAARRLSGLEAQHFRLPRAGVHTALETCGLADWETFRELVPHLDLFLYDIKHMTGPPAAHGRVQPADSGQPARAVPHGQKGSDPNAAAPRTERRSRRAGGGFRHAAGGSGTRGRHRGRGTAALTAMGRGKYRQLGQAYTCGKPYPEERLEELKAFFAAQGMEGLPLRLVRNA